MDGSAEPSVASQEFGSPPDPQCLRSEPGANISHKSSLIPGLRDLAGAALISPVLAVVENRELLRHCLTSWLAKACPEFQTIPLPSLNCAEANAVIGHADIVVLVASDGIGTDPVLGEQIRLIRTVREVVPIAVIGDPDVRTAEDFIQRFRVSGYISVTSTSEVAAAALRLMAAGGRYIPFRADAAPLNGHSDDGRDLPAITQEGEVLLTRRERAVLECLRRGLPNKLIAYDLGISIGTVKMHVHNLMAKLRVHNRTEAALTHSESIGRICSMPDREDIRSEYMGNFRPTSRGGLSA